MVHCRGAGGACGLANPGRLTPGGEVAVVVVAQKLQTQP